MLSEALKRPAQRIADRAERVFFPRLTRVWKAERFAWWLTGLTHRFPGNGPIDRRLQRAEFDYLRQSRAAQTAFAENYVGLPLDDSSARPCVAGPRARMDQRGV